MVYRNRGLSYRDGGQECIGCRLVSYFKTTIGERDIDMDGMLSGGIIGCGQKDGSYSLYELRLLPFTFICTSKSFRDRSYAR